MHRCFIEDNLNVGDTVCISGDEAIHILKVLRYKAGDEFEICNNTGVVALAEIENVEGKKLDAHIKTVTLSDKEPERKMYVFQGLSKGTKMELVVQKATELGAYAVVPVKMDFSVVKLKDEIAKTERWQKVAFEAAKQCKRAVVPEVLKPVEFKEAVKMMAELDVAFVPYECEKDGSLKKLLEKQKGAETAGFIIGPEGGFSEKEIELVEQSGIPKVTLGKRILRTETAAIATLAVLMYNYGEFDN